MVLQYLGGVLCDATGCGNGLTRVWCGKVWLCVGDVLKAVARVVWQRDHHIQVLPNAKFFFSPV